MLFLPSAASPPPGVAGQAESADAQQREAGRSVYDPVAGYAGTLDCLALVNGVPTILDWKSGKAIYPEMLLRAVAYRHAAACQGLVAEQAIIVRVPKLIGDAAPETMLVPESVTISDFLAALTLWRWQRAMEGKPVGTRGTRPCAGASA